MFKSVRVVAPRVVSQVAKNNGAFAPVKVMAGQARGMASLGSILGKEFKEEKSGYSESDELVEIKQTIVKTFKIEETPGHSVVKLTANHKDEKIHVTFDVQEEMQDDSPMDMDDEEMPAEEEGQVAYRFVVNVAKNGQQLVFDCAAGAEVEIRNINIIPEGVKYESEATNELYSGPNFADLDDNLKDAFYEYLSERKIDADFSFFVAAYAHDKEQREYTQWLKSVGEFVGSKPQLN
jgi:complement component 1 Q subcomponent-binding protein